MLNIAHRGASAYAPENTFAAFYKAIDMKADGIETDVRITSDGKLVLYHDYDISKKTKKYGSINDFKYEEIAQIDIGSWFSHKYKGERIVLFEDFLFYFAKRDLKYQIELKDSGCEKKVIDLVMKYNVCDNVVITSFMVDVLTVIKNINPGIRTGWLLKKYDSEIVEKARSLNIDILSLHHDDLNNHNISYIRKNNFGVRAWGVDNVQKMNRLIELGIDGMTVNFPDKFYETIKKKENINTI